MERHPLQNRWTFWFTKRSAAAAATAPGQPRTQQVQQQVRPLLPLHSITAGSGAACAYQMLAVSVVCVGLLRVGCTGV